MTPLFNTFSFYFGKLFCQILSSYNQLNFIYYFVFFKEIHFCAL